MGDHREDQRRASTSSGASRRDPPPAVHRPSGSPSPPSSESSDEAPQSIATQRKRSNLSVEVKKSSISSVTSGTSGPVAAKTPAHTLSYQLSVDRANRPAGQDVRRQSLQLPMFRSMSQPVPNSSDMPAHNKVLRRAATQIERQDSMPVRSPTETVQRNERRRTSSAARRQKKSSVASQEEKSYNFPLPSEIRASPISEPKLMAPQRRLTDDERQTSTPLEEIVDKKLSTASANEFRLESPELHNRDPSPTMWKHSQSFSSVHDISELKRQKMDKNAQPENEDDDDRPPSSGQKHGTSGGLYGSKDTGLQSRSSSVSRRPYNVIFESDEAISESTVDGKGLVRHHRLGRGKSVKSPQPDTDHIPDNAASVFLALKTWEAMGETGLQKILDLWYAQLRQALLAENAVVREKILAEFDRSTRELMKSQQQDTERLHADIDSLHNLCRSYSKAIHERDRTIANLADAVAVHKEQTQVARSMAVSRRNVEDDRREVLLNEVASRLYRKKLLQFAWNTWRSAMQERVRQGIEEACRKRAEEVCHQMADKYDAKIAALEDTIRRLREENRKCKADRDRVTVNARDALMHGVDVLNDEAKRFPDVPDVLDSSEKTISRKASSNRDSRSVTSADTRHSRSRASGDDGQVSDSKDQRPGRRGHSIGDRPLPVTRVLKHQSNRSGEESGNSGDSDKSSGRS